MLPAPLQALQGGTAGTSGGEAGGEAECVIVLRIVHETGEKHDGSDEDAA